MSLAIWLPAAAAWAGRCRDHGADDDDDAAQRDVDAFFAETETEPDLTSGQVAMMIREFFEGPDTEMAIAAGIIDANGAGQIDGRRYPYDAALTVLDHLRRHGLRVRREGGHGSVTEGPAR